MKKLLFTAAALAALQAQGQTNNTKNYEAAVSRFQQFYNANQPDSIFNMFNAEMKAGLPLEKTRATVSTLHTQLGNLKNTTLLSSGMQGNNYKGVFDAAIVKLVLVLDGKNQLSGLWVQPYTEPSAPAMETDTRK